MELTEVLEGAVKAAAAEIKVAKIATFIVMSKSGKSENLKIKTQKVKIERIQ